MNALLKNKYSSAAYTYNFYIPFKKHQNDNQLDMPPYVANMQLNQQNRGKLDP